MERPLLYVQHPNPWAPSPAPSCLLSLVAFHQPTTLHPIPQHLVLREPFCARVTAARLPRALLPMERPLLYIQHPNLWAPSPAPSCLLSLVAFHQPTTLHPIPQHLVLREPFCARVTAARLPRALLPMERPLLHVQHPNLWAPSPAPSCLLSLVAFHQPTTLLHRTCMHLHQLVVVLRDLPCAQVSVAQISGMPFSRHPSRLTRPRQPLRRAGRRV